MRQAVKLNTTRAGGITQRKILEDARKVARKAGKSADELKKRFKELEPVRLEPGTHRLLFIFDTLDGTRAYDLDHNIPLALTFSEIKAFVELTDQRLTPWEVGTIKAMDLAFIDESYKLRAGNK